MSNVSPLDHWRARAERAEAVIDRMHETLGPASVSDDIEHQIGYHADSLPTVARLLASVHTKACAIVSEFQNDRFGGFEKASEQTREAALDDALERLAEALPPFAPWGHLVEPAVKKINDVLDDYEMRLLDVSSRNNDE